MKNFEALNPPPFLVTVINEIPMNTKTLIDVGCGKGVIGALTRIYRKPERLLGIELFRPYLDFCNKNKFYDETLCWDLRELPLPFKDREFDVAVLMDVIEHLPKKTGIELLDELERLAKTKIITTPTAYFPHRKLDSNPHQLHLSHWTVRDFTKRGYAIKGMGWFQVRGKQFKVVSSVLSILSRNMFPQCAPHFLAKK